MHLNVDVIEQVRMTMQFVNRIESLYWKFKSLQQLLS